MKRRSSDSAAPTGAALRAAIDSGDANAIEAAFKAGNSAGVDAALLREGVLKLASLTTDRSPRLLVVWDFDWSLINENSDTYVIERLDPSGEIWRAAEKKMTEGMEWTALMNWAAGQLHAKGHSPQAIRDALASAPVSDGALAAVAAAQAAGAEQRILSDANTVYIQTILEARGLADAFTKVETNPAHFDAAGRLHIEPHQPDGRPHDSPDCPPNLCKGTVLARWLEELQPSTCVYIGDGGGDFCPATRLRVGDTLLARRAPHHSLLRRCRAEPARIRARVVEWGGNSDRGARALAAGMSLALGQ